MSFYRGPKVVTAGLVFGYDTGYPVVSGSSDTYRFNLGEPTTNVLNDTIQGGGSGTSLGSDSFGEYIQLGDNTSGYSYFRLPSITLSSNETYTWSFELYTTETFNRETNNYSFDQNEYSDQHTGNDASRASFSQSQPNSIPAGQWTPFKLTVTMKDNLTGAYTQDLFRFYYPAFQNKKVYYRNMQFERDKDHKTPYAGQGGSRSNTGALIDLTKNSSIDLSNVSFNSDAQMTFNGTDDYVEVPSFFVPTGSRTVEVVVKLATIDNGSQQRHIFANSDQPGNGTGDAGLAILYRDGHYRAYIWEWNGATSPRTTLLFETDIPVDKYYHLVLTHDDLTARGYTNGVLTTSGSCEGSRFPSNDTTIGRYAPSYSNGFNGDIPLVRVYDKVLTDEEVANNFNAIKNRFNI